MYQKAVRKFNVIAFTITALLCGLLPFFFLPSTISGLGATKAALLYIAVLLAFSFWLIAQFLQGAFKLPNHRALWAIAVWVLLVFISALASKNVTVSLWGRGFSVDSFATVAIIGLFTFLVASFARDQRRLVQLFLAAFAGSVFTVFLQVVLYVCQHVPFVAHYLSSVTTQGTLVGSWIDFAYFVIFTFLLGLLMYEVLMPKGLFKTIALIAMVLSLIVLIFLNFKIAWIITIVSALLVFVYKSSVERSIEKEEKTNQPFPIVSFLALLIGLFFFLSSNAVGASLAHYAGISFTNIRPSFSTTTHVMRAELDHSPLFGGGPGRYTDIWNLYHPLTINSTPFWNTEFDSGNSYMQSVLTTNGILPTVFLALALLLALVHGFRLFNYQFPDRFSRFIGVTAVIMLIAFIVLLVFASPGLVLIVLGFMYVGLLIGVSTLVGRTHLSSFEYLHDPRTSFFAILAIVVAAMAGFSAVYFSGSRFVSVIYYNRALAATDQFTAQARLEKAVALAPNDIYWRTATQLYVSEFTQMAGQQNPDKNQLQNTFTAAEQNAQAAVAWDSTSADNWLTLSQVYQLVVNAQNANAYTEAKAAADQALALNPNNPVFVLNEAQLAMTKQDAGAADDYIAQAMALKQDYIDAYVLKAQIQSAGGDVNAGVEEMTAYTEIAPFDDQGFILLGQAELQIKDYQDALAAFARARSLAPTDPNDYLQYIGALEVTGQKDQAIAALQDFHRLFPQIQGVDQQIERIQVAPAVTPTPVVTTPSISPKKK